MRQFWIAAALLIGCAENPPPQADSNSITLYRTTAVTMDPAQPLATGVAIQADGIAAVGDFDQLSRQFSTAQIDESFSDLIMLPGLIDPHVHMALGAMMYGAEMVPPWDVPMANGVVSGLKNREALLSRIAEIEAKAVNGPLILWGYHDLIQGDVRRADLDAINADRPVMLWHWSGHDFYLNSAAIEFVGATPALAEQFHGVELDEKGELTGRIYEDALLAIFPKLASILMSPEHIMRGWTRYEALLEDAGVTTVAEMGYGIFGREMEDQFMSVFYDETDSYRLYLVPEHRAWQREFGDNALTAMKEAGERDPKILPQVKLFNDAAFYSQTMKLSGPGYVGGQSVGTNGLYVTEPDALPALMAHYWNAGLDIHVHSNGDAAQDSTIAAIRSLEDGTADQRVILEHVALLRPDQIEALTDLPTGVSAASHYVRYMGTAMVKAIGDKAAYLSPMGSTARSDIPTTLHSDAPLAPPYPLLAAQAHLLRDTEDGAISLPQERLSPAQALRAITLDAAWSLGLEDRIGSIEAGKLADFTIVDRNPLDTAPEDWDEIKVLGRIKGGTASR